MGVRGPIKGTPAARRCGEHRRATPPDRTESLPPLPVSPPAWLPAEAAVVWREVAPLAARRATAADAEVMAAYCVLAAGVRVMAARAAHGDVEVVSSVATLLARLERAAKELGLTPASRARIPEHEAPREKSALLELIRGGA